MHISKFFPYYLVQLIEHPTLQYSNWTSFAVNLTVIVKVNKKLNQTDEIIKDHSAYVNKASLSTFSKA